MVGRAKMALTAKQAAFCEEAIQNGFNYKRAYMKAFGCKNERTAESGACKLKKLWKINNYIDELLSDAFKHSHINADRIALQLSEMAFDRTGRVTNKDKLRALDLLQKQLSLQNQNISADVNKDVVINIGNGIDIDDS